MKNVLLSASLVLATASVAAAGEKVTYDVDGAPYEGYYVSPGGKAPLILLVHDWGGLDDYEIKRSDMLAAQGYAVFAADLYGAGVRPEAMEERRRLTGELYANPEKMLARLRGALDAAAKQGGSLDNAVAMGYCFGGAAVLTLARSGADLEGFATFHGGLAIPSGEDYSKTKGRIIVFHGSADSAVTMDDFAALTRQLEQDGVPHEMITYSGAPHAFTVFGSERYREDADHKSWNRFLEFLDETLRH